MGIGTLQVAPEIIGDFIRFMPNACRIVGTAESFGAIALLIEAAEIPDGAKLIATVRHNRMVASIAITVLP